MCAIEKVDITNFTYGRPVLHMAYTKSHSLKKFPFAISYMLSVKETKNNNKKLEVLMAALKCNLE